MRFVVTKQHLKLLYNMFIVWNDCEFGAPAVDCKRPYGNKDVYSDIGDILDIEHDVDGEEPEYSKEKEAEFEKLHKEMDTVLQILVQHAEAGLKVGTYEREGYIYWKFIGE
jgi:hypothetical protein